MNLINPPSNPTPEINVEAWEPDERIAREPDKKAR
jgi:hypothetical protein